MHICLPGRALLRLKDHHLELLGVEAEEQQQEILQDLLLLRVQEEINELCDICSGENAKQLYLLGVTELQTRIKQLFVFFKHCGGGVDQQPTPM